MKYEFFDHTADAMFRAYGKNIEDKFVNSALATFSIMVDLETVKATKTLKVELQAKDMTALLYDFIDDLLFKMDTELFVLKEIKNMKISKDFKLTCELIGDDSSKYNLHSGVKAATYNNMEITDEYVQMVVDI